MFRMSYSNNMVKTNYPRKELEEHVAAVSEAK